MIRTRPPGGRLTARQLRVHLDLADRVGEGTLRITSRQGLQIHGVAKGNLRAALQEIHASLLTTLGACGDVSRNVMCCPAPLRGDRVRARLQSIAAEIARHFTPRSAPYYEIWLEDELAPETGIEEPVYGPTYLPRKFKTALALPEDNCVDVFTQDIGLLAVVEEERLLGFNVLVGGGLGFTAGREDTFPRLAEPLAYADAADALRVLDAIVQVHRGYSSRSDRRRARLKYLLADWGAEKLQAAVEGVLERALAPPRELGPIGYDDHLGWRDQLDGRFALGVPISCGRIADAPGLTLKTALRTLLTRNDLSVRLTPQQNLILCDLAPEQEDEVKSVLAEAGVPPADELSPLRRNFLACPAFPTCGLALAEAERLAPALLARLEQEIARRGMSAEGLTLRISGCPSGCARSATADLALVGRGRDRYAVYAGGRLNGDRLNVLVREDVAESNLVEALIQALARVRGDHAGARDVSSFSHPE
jgi:sulfite reductase (ferredoxin)